MIKMRTMSPFRCSIFKIYTTKLGELLDQLIELISDNTNEKYQELLMGLKSKINRIKEYASSDCSDISLDELDNILFDIGNAIKAINYSEENENLKKICTECLNILQQMKSIIDRELTEQPTAPYPGILYLPFRIENHIGKSLQLSSLGKIQLTGNEEKVLRYLQKHKEKKTLSELSRELNMDRGNLFRILKTLVLKGLVKREYDMERRKIVYSAMVK